MGIEKTQLMIGHVNLETTRGYSRVGLNAEERRQSAVKIDEQKQERIPRYQAPQQQKERSVLKDTVGVVTNNTMPKNSVVTSSQTPSP